MMMATTRRNPNDKVLTPVHASAGVRAWYEKKLHDLLCCMNDSMQTHIAAAWKSATPSIGFAQDDANSSVVLRRAINRWGRLWQSKFDALSSDLARKFADKNFSTTQNAMQASLKAAGFTVAFKPTPASVEAYQAVAGENIALIKSIPQQYLTDVREQVFQSVMRGGDLATLSKSIQEKYGVAHRRAAFIARDQNLKAKSIIENVRRTQLGIETAIWLHSGGGREPRPSHVAYSGKPYNIKEGALIDGERIWPGVLPNCRCVSKPVLPGYND